MAKTIRSFVVHRVPTRNNESILGCDHAILSILLITLVSASVAGAAECVTSCDCPCPSGLMLCCPDNYCRKPLPYLPCPQLGCCPDNYCRKPLPGLCAPVWSCCADDYCRKPLPFLCWPPLPARYSCGAPCVEQTSDSQ